MDLLGEPVLTISEHHLFHRQITELCERVGAVVRRDYEGTSLDTLRQMVVMGMGIAFLPALYVKSEIRDKKELRVTDVEGINVVRNHALVWRNTSPVRNFTSSWPKRSGKSSKARWGRLSFRPATAALSNERNNYARVIENKTFLTLARRPLMLGCVSLFF